MTHIHSWCKIMHARSIIHTNDCISTVATTPQTSKGPGLVLMFLPRFVDGRWVHLQKKSEEWFAHQPQTGGFSNQSYISDNWHSLRHGKILRKWVGACCYQADADMCKSNTPSFGLFCVIKNIFKIIWSYWVLKLDKDKGFFLVGLFEFLCNSTTNF